MKQIFSIIFLIISFFSNQGYSFQNKILNIDPPSGNYSAARPLLSCDSLIITGENNGKVKYVFTYDNIGNIISEFCYEKGDGNSWSNRYWEISTFDSLGVKLSELHKEWDGNDWIPFTNWSYSYNSQKNIVYKIKKEWLNGTWTNNYQIIYEYDSLNYTKKIIEQEWHDYYGNGGQWDNKFQYLYKFDVDGNLVQRISEIWNGIEWAPQWKDSLKYDDSRLMVFSREGLSDNGEGDEWFIYYQWKYLYDNQNHLISIIEDDWDGLFLSMFKRNTFTYNSQGVLSSNLNELFINGQWQSFGNIKYLYDNDGKLKLGLYESNNNGVWSKSSTVFSFKDLSGKIHQFVASQIEFYYHDITSVTANPQIALSFNLFQNFPNPFNPKTNIKYRITKLSKIELTIYNCLGEKVKTLVNAIQNEGEYTVQFDGNELPSGIYLYRLEAEDFVETKKLYYKEMC